LFIIIINKDIVKTIIKQLSQVKAM